MAMAETTIAMVTTEMMTATMETTMAMVEVGDSGRGTSQEKHVEDQDGNSDDNREACQGSGQQW